MKEKKITVEGCGSCSRHPAPRPNRGEEVHLSSIAGIVANAIGAGSKRVSAILQFELLNEKEVSKILKTPLGTLRRWRSAGEGPVYIKLGTGPKAAVRYHPLDIEQFVDEGRRDPIRAGNTGGKRWP